MVRGCPVPVVIAGGSKLSDEETLDMIEGAMEGWGRPDCPWERNVFQHEDPEHFVRVAQEMVHNGMPARKALKMLRRQL